MSTSPLSHPGASNTSRVSIVEDNVVFRGMLELIIESVPELEKMSSYGTLRGIRDALRSPFSIPDYIVLDIVLPDGKGWEILDEEPIASGRTKVFFATGKIDQYTLLFFAQRKVAGFIDKLSSSITEWSEAFNCMANGQRYCSPALIAEVTSLALNSNHWSRMLTQRELEVLPFLASGKTSLELAQSLGSSPATVQVHRKNIMRKIKVNSTPELMRWARASGVST